VERIVSAVAMITNPATEEPLTVSIGLAFRTMRSRGPQLLDEASAAMEECRQLGGDRWAAFSLQTATMHEVERRRVTELTRAIENNELGLYFQPIVSLETGEVRGAEALVRWIHPVDGVLYPAEFVATAEGGGLIGALTEKVLREATAHLKEWAPLLNEKEFFLGVNVSAADIADDEFVARVDAALRHASVPPSLLTIELTETAVLADVERAAASLVRLRNLGLSVALDDFGTGYASLAVLRELPVDVMKIDQSFVSGLPDNHDAAVVRLILGLAEELGLRVTAEGVETEEQRKVLFDLGCRTGQGYLFGAPLTAEDFEDRYLR
jgi:EAL domain-containing protein (putative c-di-GMP-specific phosphodiesterase class I)